MDTQHTDVSTTPWACSRAVTVALVAVIVALACADVFLAIQNRGIKTQLTSARAMLTPQVGERPGLIKGTGFNGRPKVVVVGMGAAPLLVYAFSKGCAYCQENWPQIRRAAEEANRYGFRVLYVDPSGEHLSAAYLKKHGAPQGEVLTRIDAPDEAMYGMRLLPETVLVGSTGAVRWSHTGEFTGSLLQSLLHAISDTSGGIALKQTRP